MFEEQQETDDVSQRRPLSMILLAGLYMFFFLLTVSTYSSPFPCLGRIYEGMSAQLFVFIDSLISLYLFLGVMKRQRLTWYFLLSYNLFELVNTIVNLLYITPAEVEKIAGRPVDSQALLTNNVFVMCVIVLLSIFIYRQKRCFTNESPYIF